MVWPEMEGYLTVWCGFFEISLDSYLASWYIFAGISKAKK